MIALNALARVALRTSTIAVVAAGISAVFCGNAGTDHLCSNVSAVGQQALGNEASISINVQNSATRVKGPFNRQCALPERFFAPETGTKIRIILPLAQTDLPDSSPANAPNTMILKSFDGVRLLCADDNAVNLMVLREMLSPTGAIITQVENGQQAIEAWVQGLAQDEPFVMLLLDIAMPVCDGLSALAEIRAAEHDRGLEWVPAIAVTANAMASQVSDYIAGGFDTHLAKPFKQDDLFFALSPLL